VVEDVALVDEGGEPVDSSQLLRLRGSGFGGSERFARDEKFASVTVSTAAGRSMGCAPDASAWTDIAARCTLESPARYGVVTVVVDGQASAAYLWRKDRARVHNASRADGGELDALPTEGGTVIVFAGIRFGSAESVHPIAARATYETAASGALVYETEGCAVSAAYDRVECASSPGLGEGHVWRLFVDGDVIGRAAITCVGVRATWLVLQVPAMQRNTLPRPPASLAARTARRSSRESRSSARTSPAPTPAAATSSA